jgi:phage major head subunit gpT-like protein
VNDDMGALTGVASDLGRAAKMSIELDFYALLALNAGLGPNMSDGVTLFHANHKNITTGAALSAANLDLDRVAMASQTDVSGNEILDLKPNTLLVPVSLGGQARVINDSAYDPDTVANKSQMKPNIAGKMFRDIVDTARMTGTRRYLFADKDVAPTFEVAFLDGNQQPQLESQMGFDTDGVRWRVVFDYVVGAIDFRGAITNAGV